MVDANLDTLARTIWGEARNQEVIGMVAVANVVMNRVKLADRHSRFGLGTAASACRAHAQFSCWNPGDPNLPKLQAVDISDPVFAKCIDISRQALNGALDDITFGATYYYVDGSPMPVWAIGKTPCAVIGRHRFFRDIA